MADITDVANVPSKPSTKASIVKQKCSKGCVKFFDYFGLFLMVVLLIVLGALVFPAFEKVTEYRKLSNVRFKARRIDRGRKLIIKRYKTELRKYGEMTKQRVHDEINEYHAQYIDAIAVGYTGSDVKGKTPKWTFTGGLLFSLTTLSSIGYGTPHPTSDDTRFVFLLYTILGLPLTLIFLAQLSGRLGKLLSFVWSNFFCLICNQMRIKSYKRRNLTFNKEYLSYMQMQPPALFTFGFMVLFVIAGGLLFESVEGWSLISSIYFCFVTVSTIGFGDFLPANDNNKRKQWIAMAFIFASLVIVSVVIYNIIIACFVQMPEDDEWMEMDDEFFPEEPIEEDVVDGPGKPKINTFIN